MEGKLLMVVVLTLLVIVTPQPFSYTFKDALSSAKPGVWVEGNGYRNVTVGVSDDLLEADCEVLVDSIKVVIRAASQLLHQATHGALYFGEVTIVLPSTWVCPNISPESSVPMTWRDAHVLVGGSHPVFGEAPWTQQPRGCGEEGDFIYLASAWLKSYQQHADSSSIKDLVRQWARYRWGVFGEEGYMEDPVHPPTYLHLNSSSTYRRPNLCHNGDLQGEFSGNCDDGESASCSFSINPSMSSNVTSSLMALPNLQSVMEFCDEGTHNAAVPTKHNLMCGGSSVWEVINKHPDIIRKEWLGDVEPLFRVMRTESSTQPSHLEMVLVLQYTSTMAETLNRWKFLRDAVRTFLLVEAPKGTKVGLVTLTDSATILASLTTLTDAASRQSLANKVPENPPSTKATKNLEAGITEAVTMLADEGLVVLMVENLNNHTSETSESLVAAAGNTSVWAVLYPHLSTASTNLYQDLVGATNGSLLTVVNPYGPKYQSVDDLVALNDHLRTILQAILEPLSVLIMKDQALCQASCSLTLQINDTITYPSEIILEVSFLSFDAAGIKNIEMKAPDGTLLTPSAMDEHETMRHHFYTQAQMQQTGNYTVVIERLTYVDGIMVTLLVRPCAPILPAVWASESLHELHQSNSSAPSLFVQLWQGECYLVRATVTAILSSSTATANVTLVLTDDGTRGDVTGGDGIYSGVIVGLTGQTSINIVAHDNGGAALLVGSCSSHTLLTSDKVMKSGSHQVCCGSHIDLSQVKTEPAGSFHVSSSVEATFLGQPADDLPPGRVTDLRVEQSADSLNLHFTASGEDYYTGEAVAYEVTCWTSISSEAVVEVVNAPPASNSQITLVLPQNECDVLVVFSICALDAAGTKSEVSNEARSVIPCALTANDSLTTSDSSTDVSTTSPTTTSVSDSSTAEITTNLSTVPPTTTSVSDSSTAETPTVPPTTTSVSDSSTAETPTVPPTTTSVSDSSTAETPTVDSTLTPQTSSGSPTSHIPTSTPDSSTTKPYIVSTSTPTNPDISSTTRNTTKTDAPSTTTATTPTTTTGAPSPSSKNKLGLFLGSVFGGLLFLALAGIAAEYIYAKVSSNKGKRRS